MNYSYHSLCVFCGSADHLDPEYYSAAREMGDLLAKKKISLVYGGGRTGMMGALAEGCMQSGGEVIGVVPVGLDNAKLVYTTELARTEITENIQIRKARMMELSDGFIALPGGYGTLDELFEVLTWSQIGLHHKPTGLLNTNGYFDDLLNWIQRAFSDHFIFKEHLGLFVVDATPAGLLEKMENFNYPHHLEHWVKREE